MGTQAPAGAPNPVLYALLTTGWFMEEQGGITWDM